MHMPARLKVAVKTWRSREQQRLNLLFFVRAVIEQELLVYCRHLETTSETQLTTSVQVALRKVTIQSAAKL